MAGTLHAALLCSHREQADEVEIRISIDTDVLSVLAHQQQDLAIFAHNRMDTGLIDPEKMIVVMMQGCLVPPLTQHI
jgi:hypothetical protein